MHETERERIHEIQRKKEQEGACMRQRERERIQEIQRKKEQEGACTRHMSEDCSHTLHLHKL